MVAASTPRHATRQRMLAAVVVVIALVAGTWLMSARDRRDGESPAPSAHPADVAPQPRHEPAAAAPAVSPAPSASTPQVPAGLSDEQYQQLRDSLAGHPQQEAEVARVVAYLQFASQWQQFQQRRADGAPVSELQPLARSLDAALDTRLQRREMAAAEALQVKAALLEVLQPDASSHAATLREWRARSVAGAPPAAADAQTVAFERRQAEIVAAWRALPPAQRDEARLEAELEALRRTMFPDPADPQGGPR